MVILFVLSLLVAVGFVSCFIKIFNICIHKDGLFAKSANNFHMDPTPKGDRH